jgi:CheY-like chemotaxis protein
MSIIYRMTARQPSKSVVIKFKTTIDNIAPLSKRTLSRNGPYVDAHFGNITKTNPIGQTYYLRPKTTYNSETTAPPSNAIDKMPNGGEKWKRGQATPPTAVLFMDDSAMARKLYHRKLTEAGFAVDTANDGNEALEELERNPGKYDFVLADIVIIPCGPLDGIGLLRAMKQEGASAAISSVPVVILTSLDEPSLGQTCGEMGAAGFLCKPLKVTELQDILVDALGGDDGGGSGVNAMGGGDGGSAGAQEV